MSEFRSLFQEILKAASDIAGLPTSTILALLLIGAIFYIHHITKQHDAYDEAWQAIRLKDAEAKLKMAEIFEQVTDRLVSEMLQIKIILDERLKKNP
ncbi:MAG: hypothetical protein MN733_00500 [Nitrososphaera sp.]|nr:hypothetical protein [Nitrososphaera sp.]